MTDKEMIEQRCQKEGLPIQGWDEENENGLTAKLGSFTVVTDDYADDGLYIDDEGTLEACVVGAEEYHNRRVSFSFKTEGMDSSNEVRDLLALDPTDN